MLGKLPCDKLNEYVLDIIKKRRSEVVTSACLAEDCAVFNLDGDILISSDPITGATNNLGSLAINISANDISASGGEPILALFTLIMPENENMEMVKEIMLDAEKTAKELNIEIAGGHTEYSNAVIRPVASVTMVGRAYKNKVLSTSLNDGDDVLVTKHLGIEGTSIIASDFENKLKEDFTLDEIEKAKDYIKNISVVKEGKILSCEGATSMHDITEGGLFGAITEISTKTGKGFEIDLKKVPVTDLTRRICEKLSLSPYTLISSGSMLFTAKDGKKMVQILAQNGVQATIIGKVKGTKPVAKLNEKIIEMDKEFDKFMYLSSK